MAEEWVIQVEHEGKINYLGRREDGRILLVFSDRNLADQEAAFCRDLHHDRIYTVVPRTSVKNYDPSSN